MVCTRGADGQIRQRKWRGRSVIEKRFRSRFRQHVDVLCLRALADHQLPVPELLEVRANSILMSLVPSERQRQRQRQPATAAPAAPAGIGLVQRLHKHQTPVGLPRAPDDAAIIARYPETPAGHLFRSSCRRRVCGLSVTALGPTATSSPWEPTSVPSSTGRRRTRKTLFRSCHTAWGASSRDECAGSASCRSVATSCRGCTTCRHRAR